MSPEEFAKIYENCRESAIKIAVKKAHVTQEQAEDALQNAVCYLMENLDRFQEITPSYFWQLMVSRARSIVRSEKARAANRERSVGDSVTLADVEEADYIRRKGAQTARQALQQCPARRAQRYISTLGPLYHIHRRGPPYRREDGSGQAALNKIGRPLLRCTRERREQTLSPPFSL